MFCEQKTGRTLLPLPKGEGWGEGEANVQTSPRLQERDAPSKVGVVILRAKSAGICVANSRCDHRSMFVRVRLKIAACLQVSQEI